MNGDSCAGCAWVLGANAEDSALHYAARSRAQKMVISGVETLQSIQLIHIMGDQA